MFVGDAYPDVVVVSVRDIVEVGLARVDTGEDIVDAGVLVVVAVAKLVFVGAMVFDGMLVVAG